MIRHRKKSLLRSDSTRASDVLAGTVISLRKGDADDESRSALARHGFALEHREGFDMSKLSWALRSFAAAHMGHIAEAVDSGSRSLTALLEQGGFHSTTVLALWILGQSLHLCRLRALSGTECSQKMLFQLDRSFSLLVSRWCAEDGSDGVTYVCLMHKMTRAVEQGKRRKAAAALEAIRSTWNYKASNFARLDAEFHFYAHCACANLGRRNAGEKLGLRGLACLLEDYGHEGSLTELHQMKRARSLVAQGGSDNEREGCVERSARRPS